MPYNKVNDVHKLNVFLALENAEHKKQALAASNPTHPQLISRALEDTTPAPTLPMYIPGMLVVPIPDAGCILGRVDMSFWAVFIYVIGSVVYMIDSLLLWKDLNTNYSDDALNPALSLNTAASALFVLNAVVCFFDWWLQTKQLSVYDIPEINRSRDGASSVVTTERESRRTTGEDFPLPNVSTMYYFINNMFFMTAAMVFMVQSMWWENARLDIWDCSESMCDTFWMYFLGGLLYLISSVFSVLEFEETKRQREIDKLPELFLFTTDFNRVDWFGWGDWLYFLTSIVAVLEPLIEFYIYGSSMFAGAYYAIESFLFLLDSVCYFIGYMVFVRDLRAALQSGYIDKQYADVLIPHHHRTIAATASAVAGEGSIGQNNNNNNYNNDDLDEDAFESEATAHNGQISLLMLTKRIDSIRRHGATAAFSFSSSASTRGAESVLNTIRHVSVNRTPPPVLKRNGTYYEKVATTSVEDDDESSYSEDGGRGSGQVAGGKAKYSPPPLRKPLLGWGNEDSSNL